MSPEEDTDLETACGFPSNGNPPASLGTREKSKNKFPRIPLVAELLAAMVPMGLFC